MAKQIIPLIIFLLFVSSFGIAQNAAQQKAKPVQPPGTLDLVDEMAQRLSHDLNVKTVTGEPIKIGSVTLIPILMIDLKFGSAATKAPSGAVAPQSAEPHANLFL